MDTVAIAPHAQKELPRICEKAAVYWAFLRKLHRRRYSGGLRGALQKAALLWEHQLFFEFHEILEDVWMDWKGPERSFLQGLIQLGVAFYHIQRNKPSYPTARQPWNDLLPSFSTSGAKPAATSKSVRPSPLKS
ncbi:MAG: DUF309 domain-containing protein [Akkermansiaceae bacterium]|nr:DUF309 domain-containing protein [Akkermansiaceae bacterium]